MSKRHPNLKACLVEAWLRSKKADDLVGTRVHPEYCPIATYFKQVWNEDAEVATFNDDYLYFKGPWDETLEDDEAINANSYSMPMWAQRLVIEIDATPAHRQKLSEEVTAAEALMVLKGCVEKFPEEDN